MPHQVTHRHLAADFSAAKDNTGLYTGFVMPMRNTMNIEVGSNEAKSKLPELLLAEAAADLAPTPSHKRLDAATAAEHMRVFMRSRQQVAGVDLKALISEGRA